MSRAQGQFTIIDYNDALFFRKAVFASKEAFISDRAFLNSFSPSSPIFNPKLSAIHFTTFRQIPSGITSSMKYSRLGFETPVYC